MHSEAPNLFCMLRLAFWKCRYSSCAAIGLQPWQQPKENKTENTHLGVAEFSLKVTAVHYSLTLWHQNLWPRLWTITVPTAVIPRSAFWKNCVSGCDKELTCQITRDVAHDPDYYIVLEIQLHYGKYLHMYCLVAICIERTSVMCKQTILCTSITRVLHTWSTLGRSHRHTKS